MVGGGGRADQGPPTGCKTRSGAVRTAKVLSVKVRGVCGVRAQGRCVNSRRTTACVHTGAGRAGARRCAVRGVAGPEEGAGRALCPALVCQRGAGVQTHGVWRGPGFRAQGEGLRASVGLCPGRLCLPRSVGGPGCLLTPGSAGGDAGPTPGSTSAPTPASRSWIAPAPGRPLLRHPCSVAGRSSRAGASPRGWGLRGARRPNGAAPQSGHAPRSPPRAPSRSPARSPAPS